MSFSDPIADFLTRVMNASRAKIRYVDVRWNRLIENMADVLKASNLIEHYLVRQVGQKTEMRVFLKYDMNGKSLIHGIKRKSKPGRRMYTASSDVASVFNGLGISILTTSQGVLSGEEARKRNVGGEVLCYVW